MHRAHTALTISQKPRAHQTAFILSRLTGEYVNVQAVSSQTVRGKTLLKKNGNYFTRKADGFGILHSFTSKPNNAIVSTFILGKGQDKNLVFLLNLPLADYLSSPLILLFSSCSCHHLYWKCSHQRPSLQLSVGY